MGIWIGTLTPGWGLLGDLDGGFFESWKKAGKALIFWKVTMEEAVHQTGQLNWRKHAEEKKRQKKNPEMILNAK